MKQILSSSKSRTGKAGKKTESTFNVEDLDDFDIDDFQALNISDDDASDGNASN